MNPISTNYSNKLFTLQGGTEENNLPVWQTMEKIDGSPVRVNVSTWEPTKEERKLIANGAYVELWIFGNQPPVTLSVSTPDTVKTGDVVKDNG